MNGIKHKITRHQRSKKCDYNQMKIETVWENRRRILKDDETTYKDVKNSNYKCAPYV